MSKNFYLTSLATNKLKPKEIKEICKFKNTFWKWSLPKQIDWYKSYVKKNDLNNLLKIKGRLVGYNLLRKRNAYIRKKRIKYLYLDTFIIHKKYRKKGFGEILIKFNNMIIKKSNKHSFLICPKNIIPFYLKYGWKRIKKNKYTIKDHKSHWHNKFNPSKGMTFMLKKDAKIINYYLNN